MLEEEHSWAGELHAARRAHEERGAELVLETSNLAADRWLRDAKAAGRTAHVALLCDGDEVLNLREAHGAESTPSGSSMPKGYWTRGGRTRNVRTG